MKKALIVLTALAMVGLAFADINPDEPVGGAKLELSGHGTVTWGVDLDESVHGFANSSEAKIKYTLVDNDVSVSDGSDEGAVYGEVKLKDIRVFAEATDGESELKARAKFDYAKIVGPGWWVKVAGDPDVKVDYEAIIHSASMSYLAGEANKDTDDDDVDDSIKKEIESISALKTDLEEVGGFSAGYEIPDLLAIEVEVASYANWDTASPADDIKNKYMGKGKVALKAVENLDAELALVAGAKDDESLGFGAKVAYKFPITDMIAVQPIVGFDLKIDNSLDDDNLAYAIGNGLRLVWPGSEKEKKGTEDFVSNDVVISRTTAGVPAEKKAKIFPENDVWSGLTVGWSYFQNTGADVDPVLALSVSAWEDSGDDGLLPGVGFGAAFEWADVTDVAEVGGFKAFGLFADYKIGMVRPYVGFKTFLENDSATENGEAYLQAGLHLTDILPNVDLKIDYGSDNLQTDDDDAAKIGDLEIAVKVKY